MNRQLLQQYLLAQKEFGGEEIILESPFISKPRIQSPPTPQQIPQPNPIPGPVLVNRNENQEDVPAPSLRAPVQNDPAPAATSPHSGFSKNSIPSLSDFKTLTEQQKALFDSGLYQNQGTWIKPSGPQDAAILLVVTEPLDEDKQKGELFSGELGLFLNKMLKAIGLERDVIYCTSLLKLPRMRQKLTRKELKDHLAYFEKEANLLPAKIVMAMGWDCGRLLLRTAKSTQLLRQKSHNWNNKNTFITFHPGDLYNQKREVKLAGWHDLQWFQKNLLATAI